MRRPESSPSRPRRPTSPSRSRRRKPRAATTRPPDAAGTFGSVISTVIFDFGGVISSPLFVGIGAFEAAEGYPKGSLLQLLFGETHYIGVEGRAVAAAVADAMADDPDAAESAGAIDDEPDWHLL